jgi:hypothetical protein
MQWYREMMMKAYIVNQRKFKSLAGQIRDAERQILKRQQGIGVRTAMLVRKIHQQMTAPATLLLAGGIGFIVGELTKRQNLNNRGNAVKSHTTETTTPFKSALNLIISLHTFYTALPLAWIIKSLHQPGESGQATKRQYRPVATAADSCRRSA